MMVIIFLFNNKLAAAGSSKLLSGWIDRIMLGGARPGNQLGGNIEDEKDKKIKKLKRDKKMFKAAQVDTIMLGGTRPGNQTSGNIEDKKDKKIKKIKKR